jgi:hypothetical protein
LRDHDTNGRCDDDCGRYENTELFHVSHGSLLSETRLEEREIDRVALSKSTPYVGCMIVHVKPENDL